MLDWLPHNERGHVHVGSPRHLATARASAPMTVVEAPGGPVTPLVYSLIVLPYVEAVSAANPGVDGLSLVRAWYGYLYVSTENVALPEPSAHRCPVVEFERATPVELISIARATSQHPKVEATSLVGAVADLLGGEGGDCVRCCRTALAELGRRFAHDGLLDTPESIMMINDDELDDFVADPAMYSEAIRARSALFADVAGHQPPLLLDSKAPSFARWVKRDHDG
jgi:hypothetical protein